MVPLLLLQSGSPPSHSLPRQAKPVQEAGLGGPERGTAEDPSVTADDGGKVAVSGGYPSGPGQTF